MTTRIIIGLFDAEARKKLLAKEKFPTLQEVIDLCRAEESAAKTEPMLQRSKAAGVNNVSSGSGKSKNRQRSKSRDKSARGSGPVCPHWGRGHAREALCPAKGRSDR